MNRNKHLRRIISAAAALSMAVCLTFTAGAWSENPGEWEETTSAVTSAPTTVTSSSSVSEWENQVWDTEATTTTEVPDAVLEDDDAVLEDEEIAEEDDEDIEAEETTAATTTAAPVTTTARSTTTAAATTLAPATYTETEPFPMLAPQVINVRSGPGTDYSKLGTVPANSLVDVIGISGDWYAVSFNGGTGYILSSLLYEVPDDYGQTEGTTTTTPAPTDTTLPPVEDNPPAEGDGDLVIEDMPADTEAVTTPEETAPAAPAQTTTSESEEDPDAAAPIQKDGGNISFTSVLIALAAAVVAFVLVGLVPILVHKNWRKKLYQY